MLELTCLAASSLLAWVVLAFGRGMFWRTVPRLRSSPPPATWPSVVVVIPARDEADLLPATLPTVLAQRYPGDARVVLVDDQSTDGTGDTALALARGAGDTALTPDGDTGAGGARDTAPAPDGDTGADGDTARLKLTVVRAPDRPPGWAGKLWAVQQGVEEAGDATWILLTDADIAHPPGSLAALVAAGEAGDLDQVSLMARLRASAGWERLLVPAFVYFFAMLYPFRWVGRPPARHAAAAGGCVLLRRQSLEKAGGVAAVRDAVIDDVSLAQAVAGAGGRLWLGYADEVESVRPYETLGSLWHMVARSAFTQLRYSAAALVGTVIGLTLVFLVPPVVLVLGLATGDVAAAVLAGAAWVLMTATYLPMQRYYGLGWWRAATLPVAAVLYLGMTVDSARRHWTGRGAAWKGRSYHPAG